MTLPLMGHAHEVRRPDDPEFYERQQKSDDAEFEFLVVMRQALSIPEGDPSLPPPGFSYDIRPPR